MTRHRHPAPADPAAVLARLAVDLAGPSGTLDLGPLVRAATRTDPLGDPFGPLTLARAALLGHLDQADDLDRQLVTAVGLVSVATGSLWQSLAFRPDPPE